MKLVVNPPTPCRFGKQPPAPAKTGRPSGVVGKNANGVAFGVCVWRFDVRFQGQTRRARRHKRRPVSGSSRRTGARAATAARAAMASRGVVVVWGPMGTPTPWFSSPEPTRGRFVVPTHLRALAMYALGAFRTARSRRRQIVRHDDDDTHDDNGGGGTHARPPSVPETTCDFTRTTRTSRENRDNSAENGRI